MWEMWTVRTVSRSSAIVEISDQEPGTSTEHRFRVCDGFYRVDKGRSADSGEGWGLAIARWAVEAHDGQVELESEVGRGSMFRITLPLARTGKVVGV